jgi:hypothetical protein
MKKFLLIAVAVIGLGFVSAPRAEAYGGVSIGIGIGAPIGYGYGGYGYGGYYRPAAYYPYAYRGYYNAPYYGYPARVVVRRHSHWRNGHRYWCNRVHRHY